MPASALGAIVKFISIMAPADGKPHDPGKRRASIRAWFGDDMTMLSEMDLAASEAG